LQFLAQIGTNIAQRSTIKKNTKFKKCETNFICWALEIIKRHGNVSRRIYLQIYIRKRECLFSDNLGLSQ